MKSDKKSSVISSIVPFHSNVSGSRISTESSQIACIFRSNFLIEGKQILRVYGLTFQGHSFRQRVLSGMFRKLFCRFRFKVVFQEFQLGFLMQLHFNYREIQISSELIKSYDYFGLRLEHLLRIPSCHLFASEEIQIAESVIDSVGIQQNFFCGGFFISCFQLCSKIFLV